MATSTVSIFGLVPHSARAASSRQRPGRIPRPRPQEGPYGLPSISQHLWQACGGFSRFWPLSASSQWCSSRSLRVDASDRAGDAYDRVREWFGYSPQDPINAIDANASSAVDPVPFERCRPENGSLRPEDALRDGKAFTYWAEGVDGPGLDTIIEFEFQSRMDLNSIGIFSGPGTCPEADFLANPRPRSVELRYLRDDGFGLEEIGSDTLKLVDTADFQTFEVEGKDFDRLVLVILSVYDSDQGSATAIAEVEFFGKLG